MAYSINRQPLLEYDTDGEPENDPETEFDNPHVAIQDEEPFLQSYPPTDKCRLVYIGFYILGINTLVPFTFFVTADDYWMYKFRDIHGNNTGIHNYTRIGNLEKRNAIQASFASYVNVASAVPNTVFLILNTFISKKISLQTRMNGSQCIVLLLFILTTAFIQVNTDEWQHGFLIFTLLTVALINSASALNGGGLMGIVGHFPVTYITAMSGGQALAGIFTAITEISSLWIGASPIVSGLIYFIIGDIVLVVALVTFIFMEKREYYKYYMLHKVPESTVVTHSVDVLPRHRISYCRIFKKIWQYNVVTFLVFCVTTMAYPGVTVLVESQDKGKGHAWNDVYFVPVVAYLLFSTGDYFGRKLCGYLCWTR
ncbi:equilibrative nucleoside transporter 3 isoform X2 [Orussus abietinus]|uniref:equilibrative nucleoside transporter 3 isoform X2 n=1 Tax=Orussus abietinus TaxID=222816 RepID=UPI000C715E9C|nr:equilibrative nucleoside transporter 3 isoform X2 [Orussus abietinus]